MHSFAAKLTIAALLAHAGAGCCWHHGHSPAAAGDGAAIKPIVAGGHFAWKEQHASRDGCGGGPDHEHDGQPGCGETKCSFASQNLRPQIDSPLLSHSMAILVQPAAAHSQVAISAAEASYGRPSGGAIPLHLLVGVLLV
ncbi:MAG: hypothetical protein IT424_10615 [Pirellulales bacterium]|nr:hypothetical protein [Pirellulales bacterium]